MSLFRNLKVVYKVTVVHLIKALNVSKNWATTDYFNLNYHIN